MNFTILFAGFPYYTGSKCTTDVWITYGSAVKIDDSWYAHSGKVGEMQISRNDKTLYSRNK